MLFRSLIVAEDMVAGMKPGSVIVDMAASEHGGNVAGTVLNEEVEVGGVRIVGYDNLAGHVAVNASQMYASNLLNFIQHFWDDESKEMKLDRDDEIMAGALITTEGQVVSEMLLKAYGSD